MILSRLKILVIAHEFSPIQGSECALGWNIATRLGKYHDITVIYASGSQDGGGSYIEAVDNYIVTNGFIDGLTLINIDQPAITRYIALINRVFKNVGSIGLPFLYFWGYKYWQKSAFRKAKNLHTKEKFDVVHQLTQIAFREPGYWWKLGIPFFWGPTGGLESLPKQFYKLLSLKARVLENIRKFSNFYQFKISTRIIKANKQAAIIYSFSNEDVDFFRRRASGKVKLMLDVGTLNHDNKFTYEKVESSVAKGIWCGQLIERKAPIILLKALALSKVTQEDIRFQIIGNGPIEQALHQQYKSLGLNNIEWIRKVDRETVFKLMSEADFFVHTSLREATSHVIPEALSSGLPVICHDAYGMGIVIDRSCGIKIPLLSPEDSINGFHAAIEKLVLDKQLLNELKIGAKKRSLEITWDMMAETMAIDYSEIVNANKVPG